MYRSIQFITVHKRSLGQGSVFTPVCHSVHRGRRDCPRPPLPIGRPGGVWQTLLDAGLPLWLGRLPLNADSLRQTLLYAEPPGLGRPPLGRADSPRGQIPRVGLANPPPTDADPLPMRSILECILVKYCFNFKTQNTRDVTSDMRNLNRNLLTTRVAIVTISTFSTTISLEPVRTLLASVSLVTISTVTSG